MAYNHYITGQQVRLLCDIWEEGEDLPQSLLARKGETVVIRSMCKGGRPLTVSHPNVTDGSGFSVDYEEVEPLSKAAEPKGE